MIWIIWTEIISESSHLYDENRGPEWQCYYLQSLDLSTGQVATWEQQSLWTDISKWIWSLRRAVIPHPEGRSMSAHRCTNQISIQSWELTKVLRRRRSRKPITSWQRNITQTPIKGTQSPLKNSRRCLRNPGKFHGWNFETEASRKNSGIESLWSTLTNFDFLYE